MLRKLYNKITNILTTSHHTKKLPSDIFHHILTFIKWENLIDYMIVNKKTNIFINTYLLKQRERKYKIYIKRISNDSIITKEKEVKKKNIEYFYGIRNLFNIYTNEIYIVLTKKHLSKLCNDVIIKILSFLDWKKIINITIVNKEFYNLINKRIRKDRKIQFNIVNIKKLFNEHISTHEMFLNFKPISKIPENLKCKKLTISGKNTISKIPENLKCNKIYICGKKNRINPIPENLKCKKLTIRNFNPKRKIFKNFRYRRLKWQKL
jgi:hypothetical protein